jgi:alanine dehydrogenase
VRVDVSDAMASVAEGFAERDGATLMMKTGCSGVEPSEVVMIGGFSAGSCKLMAA